MIIDEELDVCPSYGWQGGPNFNTLIRQVGNGHERRKPLWDVVRHHYLLPILNITSAAYLLKLKSVFLAARGQGHSFLVKDYSDYRAQGEVFGAGDGVEDSFDLLIQSTFGSASYTRRILYPVGPTFYVNGVPAAATFDPVTQRVVFDSPPPNLAVLTWSGEFRILVRFASDAFPMTIDNSFGTNYAMNGTIELREVWE